MSDADIRNGELCKKDGARRMMGANSEENAKADRKDASSLGNDIATSASNNYVAKTDVGASGGDPDRHIYITAPSSRNLLEGVSAQC